MKPISALLLCLSFITAIRAQNWSSFRGNNASGVSDGKKTPVTWSAVKSQNIRWKTAIPGFSHASPIVWGDQVFVITAVSSDAQSGFIAKDRGIDLANDTVIHTWLIYALDKKSGRILWSKIAYEGIPKGKRHVKASHANSTPATDGRYVCALFGSEGLNCYDLDGKLIWQKDLGILNPACGTTRILRGATRAARSSTKIW
jgi:PQQ-like domain